MRFSITPSRCCGGTSTRVVSASTRSNAPASIPAASNTDPATMHTTKCRVSLGVQTLDPHGLAALGRVHSRTRALAALSDARSAGLDISADLIVGWPGQTLASLRADVTAIVDSGARHVSIYGLTIEAGTPWETLVRRGKRRLPDPEHQTDLLLAAGEALCAAGLEHYEVASYAAPGQAARHNLGYWKWRDYLGLGPSAHSWAATKARRAMPRSGNSKMWPWTWSSSPSRTARRAEYIDSSCS